MTIKLTGTLTAADTDARTLTYRLLPYGSPGHTNVGTLTVNAGAVAIPEDVTGLPLNLEHDPAQPVGKFVSVDDSAEGLNATVHVVETTAGDDALVLARAGLRSGISVELDDAEVADGIVTAARLAGAGLVVRPAFDTARLVTASDNTPPADPPKEPAVNALPTPPIKATNAKPASLGAITMAALSEGNPGKVTAALADLKTTDDAGKLYIRDQEVGELWQARLNERPIIQSIGVKPLNSLVLVGQRKTRTFAVGNWAGNKVEMPTGKFTTSQETWKASAKAVAVDVALELVEFGSEDVMAELWEQAMESYIVQTEAEVVAAMITGSTKAPAVETITSGVSAAAQAFANMGASMSAIAVGSSIYGSLVNLRTDEAPWWFSSQARMDLSGSTFDGAGIRFAYSPSLAPDQAMIYDRRAIDYRESRDIRLTAVNVAQGGYDLGFAKFKALKVTDPNAIVTFTVAEPTAPVTE